MSFQFPDAVTVGGDYRDLRIDQPETIGFGFANRSLMGGNLLIAGDVYYKLWENAALWQDVFVNQWAFAFGTQLTRGKNKFRLGYSYNTNPINHNVGTKLDGFPIAQAELQLFQAASDGGHQPAPAHGRHRAPGFPGPEPRPGPVCRRTVQRHGPVRPPHASFGRPVLRGHGDDLALRRSERAGQTAPRNRPRMKSKGTELAAKHRSAPEDPPSALRGKIGTGWPRAVSCPGPPGPEVASPQPSLGVSGLVGMWCD